MNRNSTLRRLGPVVLILVALAVLRLQGGGDAPPAPGPETAAESPRSAPGGDARGSRPRSGADHVEQLFREKASGVMVEVEAEIDRTLADDLEGSRHQRFIVRLDTGRTLLVAHNIDLAPRAPVRPGDPVTIRGQYEYNERGGVLHWTHHDPRGNREGGWIRHRGEVYR